MKLRSPFEQLAGALYLPRIVDKARLFLAGTLPREYRVAFCNRRGVDGQFLSHFALDKEELLAAVRQCDSDPLIERWFAAERQRVDAIPQWNALAPQLGRPGTAMEASFAKAQLLYPGVAIGAGVDTVFEAICLDEQLPYPKEYLRRPPGETADPR